MSADVPWHPQARGDAVRAVDEVGLPFRLQPGSSGDGCQGPNISSGSPDEDHCSVNEGSEREGRGRLIVADKPTLAAYAAELPLDSPKERLDGKACLPLLGLDDLHGDGGLWTDTIPSVARSAKQCAGNGDRPHKARSSAILPWLSWKPAG